MGTTNDNVFYTLEKLMAGTQKWMFGSDLFSFSNGVIFQVPFAVSFPGCFFSKNPDPSLE